MELYVHKTEDYFMRLEENQVVAYPYNLLQALGGRTAVRLNERYIVWNGLGQRTSLEGSQLLSLVTGPDGTVANLGKDYEGYFLTDGLMYVPTSELWGSGNCLVQLDYRVGVVQCSKSVFGYTLGHSFRQGGGSFEIAGIEMPYSICPCGDGFGFQFGEDLPIFPLVDDWQAEVVHIALLDLKQWVKGLSFEFAVVLGGFCRVYARFYLDIEAGQYAVVLCDSLEQV